MSARVAVCAIDLIRGRGFTDLRSHKWGIITPFRIYSSSSHSDSSKVPRIDIRGITQLIDAIHLFHQMLKMRPQPSISLYNELLSLTVKMKHYSFALHMFNEMRRMVVPIDNYTMTMAIDCCCLQKHSKFGFATMGIFLKSGYKPNLAALGSLINVHLLNNEVSDAVKLFKKIVDSESREPNDVKAYNALLDRSCKDGMLDDAFQLFSRMIYKGISPDVVTYNLMIQGLYNVGRGKDVKDFISKMINSICKYGEIKDAEYALEIMQQHNIYPDIVIYNALIHRYCLRREVDEAKRLFDSAVKEWGLKPDIISYNCLIKGYCRVGRVDEAWLLFLEVPSKDLDHNAYIYSIMMYGLFKKNRFVDGWKLFKDMEARGDSPNIEIHYVLLFGLCRNENIDEALSLMRKIEAKGTGVFSNMLMYGWIVRKLKIG